MDDRERRGSIIVISSILGLVACRDTISYSTVKAGLIGLRAAPRVITAQATSGRTSLSGPIEVGKFPRPTDRITSCRFRIPSSAA